MANVESTRSERMIGDVAVVDVTPGHAQSAPIVMIHGGCHGAWCWEQMQDWFADHGRRTVALDWLGHGKSTALPDEIWLKRDIIEVRDEVGAVCADLAEKTGVAPVVMGHSMGGLATLAHTALGDQKVAALVLLAPVVPAGHVESPVDVPVTLTEPWEPPPFEQARQLFYSGVPAADAERYYALLQAESPAAVWQATRFTAELPIAALREIPVLAFGAELDLLVPSNAVRSFAESIGADYVHMSGTGHGLTLDPVSEDVCRQSEEWLRSKLA